MTFIDVTIKENLNYRLNPEIRRLLRKSRLVLGTHWYELAKIKTTNKNIGAPYMQDRYGHK